MDLKATVNLFLVIAVVAWVLSLVIGYLWGWINRGISLSLLAFITAAWLLHLNADYEKQR